MAFTEEDEDGKFRFLELRNTHREFGRRNRKNLFYPFYVNPNSGDMQLEKSDKFVKVLPLWDDGFEGCWTWDTKKATRDLDFLAAREVKGLWKIYRKSYANGADKMLKTILLDKDFYTERGQKAFNQLFKTKEKIFQSPKSPMLISQLAETCTTNDSIILDFFAGSGTTAHAVLDLNKQDGGNRKFILVQLPEPTERQDYHTIADITKERVRRVIKKLNDEDDGKLNLDGASKQDRGFRVFKLAESNFKPWNADLPHDTQALERQLELHIDHIRDGRTVDDLLYEILLKSGFQLTTTFEKLVLTHHPIPHLASPLKGEELLKLPPLQGEGRGGDGVDSRDSGKGKTVHSVASGALFICLERELTLELIRAMADAKPERVVCLDEGFVGNDQLKANAVQIFKTKGVTSFKTV